jgi:hypothetical protein
MRVRGRTLRGDVPQRLELSDGSRLMLDAAPDDGRTSWRRLGRKSTSVSVAEAVDLAGEEFAEYVEVRTRAEVEWLRAVADWYRQRADRLQDQLGAARPVESEDDAVADDVGRDDLLVREVPEVRWTTGPGAGPG